LRQTFAAKISPDERYCDWCDPFPNSQYNQKTVLVVKMTDSHIKNEEHHRKVAITQALRAGRPYRETFEFFNFPRATVYRVATWYQDPETSEDDSQTAARKINITTRSARTSKVIIKVQNLI
jgi:hypothetical protein